MVRYEEKKTVTPVTVTIEDMTAEGEGVAHPEGRVLFVKGAVLGDRVEVAIDRRKKTFSQGHVQRLLTPSPDRREIPCPYQKDCDGCPLMPLKTEVQQRWKKRWMEEVLRRIGGVEKEVEFYREQEAGYRNKINLRVSPKGLLSYSKRGSNDLLAVDSCWIAHPLLSDLLGRWNQHFRQVPPPTVFAKIRMVVFRCNDRDEVMILLVTDLLSAKERESLFQSLAFLSPAVLGQCENRRPGDVNLRPPFHFFTERQDLDIQLMGLHFRLSPASFFQVNRFTRSLLYEQALALFPKAEAKDSPVLDLYCGTGTTSLLLAQRGFSVLGIESNASAVEDAKENAKRNHLKNVSFLCGKAEDLLHASRFPQDGRQSLLGTATKALVDPPRKGLHEEVVNALNRSSIRELVYISCNPATFARDLKRLGEGGFRLEKAIGIDQFPNTGNGEVVGRFSRIESGGITERV